MELRNTSFLEIVFMTQVFILFGCSADNGETSHVISKEEKEQLKEEARDMFYHAYRAYMENAYPADELMPLSCKGRWRDVEFSRGDVDESLGNFSLTLIDSLDTLVILGDIEEFEHAVRLVIRDVSFDSDIIVSVFETNIRVLGGLLSAHILARYLQQRMLVMMWYRDELLDLARDVGYRLLPAFNTTTGIPHGRVNLRYGIKYPQLEGARETCTACAGTMILEMAALSRLTGDPIFEEKAHHAMDELWKIRHRSSDLMGTVVNVHSGDWVRRDSGVGAGIDSYYEYCLKAYILLGDERYLGRFNKHYSAIMKYVSQGPLLLDVLMHRPHTNSRNFMDALLAFWPGLQVLKGDIKPAVETHEMLYQVMQRHNFIPEAFTTDFQVHWGQHLLRPEFLESTYFLYRATDDPYYLEVGEKALRTLQKHARVSCGYAAVRDVRTGIHEDRMDSFVLAETFKYLYLLFADPSDLLFDIDDFLFTTEAHFLPLSLARNSNSTMTKFSSHSDLLPKDDDFEFSRSCPNSLHLFPESVRRPLKNMVEEICPRKIKRRLHAPEFQASNMEHMKLIKDMGITILTLSDGRVQMVHTPANARSPEDAEEGHLFMQEMVDIANTALQHSDTVPQGVHFRDSDRKDVLLVAGPAHFGKLLQKGTLVVRKVTIADPLKACQKFNKQNIFKDRIVIVERGECMFVDKARHLEEAGASGVIVIDNVVGSSSTSSPMFAMSGDGLDNVNIPVVFLFHQDATVLLAAVEHIPELVVTLGDFDTLKNAKRIEPATSESNVAPEQKQTDWKLEKLKESIQEIIQLQENSVSNEECVGTPEVTPILPEKEDSQLDSRWANLRDMLMGTFKSSEQKVDKPNKSLFKSKILHSKIEERKTATLANIKALAQLAQLDISVKEFRENEHNKQVTVVTFNKDNDKVTCETNEEKSSENSDSKESSNVGSDSKDTNVQLNDATTNDERISRAKSDEL